MTDTEKWSGPENILGIKFYFVTSKRRDEINLLDNRHKLHFVCDLL